MLCWSILATTRHVTYICFDAFVFRENKGRNQPRNVCPYFIEKNIAVIDSYRFGSVSCSCMEFRVSFTLNDCPLFAEWIEKALLSTAWNCKVLSASRTRSEKKIRNFPLPLYTTSLQIRFYSRHWFFLSQRAELFFFLTSFESGVNFIYLFMQPNTNLWHKRWW